MPITQLLDAAPGAGTVGAIDMDERACGRLAELGIRPGATVSIIRRTAGGGIVVEAAGSRIALDRTTAASVQVEQP